MQMQPPSPRNRGAEAPLPIDPARLLVVGASGRALAQSAVAEGLKVDAIDLFCDSDLREVAKMSFRSINFPHDLASIAEQLPYSNWMYCGGLENHPEVIDAICEKHRLRGIRGQPLKKVRAPETLFATVPGPEFCTDPDSDQLDSTRWLMKPRKSGGGLGIHSVGNVGECRARLSNGTHYAQRLIDGQSMSTLYLGNGERVRTLASFRSIGREGTWHYQGSVGPVAVSSPQQKWLEQIGEKLVHSFQLCGIFGVDWIADRSGRSLVLEVNPRWTATAELCERSLGVPLVRWHLAACDGGELPPLSPNAGTDKLYVKRILYAAREFTFHRDAIARFDRGFRDQSELTDARTSVEWCDLPEDGTEIGTSEPICSLILSATNASAEELVELSDVSPKKEARGK